MMIYVLRQQKRLGGITEENVIVFIPSIHEYNCPFFVGTIKEKEKRIEEIRKRCHFGGKAILV